ncbi:methyl-accepting chemotaxis protein [Marinobacter nanhaiticus D15-8W]|uniref:Methyl-accepting chemotaxis protein n=1 Tax=Marinobacter nanhaiticus D15-8W TaxID=626887 RepID=N6VYK7_9GAMM|nr:methyl-accepting chemotaxis protein [Marinobacter nanhaiticus]ENO12954.1 methyl-accepting chemotaxis protein [Marinobacter nanhaiticus D15-8W]BES70305.1 methyl-accepting chemotaxis protein [Marinobacter nanhaiticus D15-8W]
MFAKLSTAQRLGVGFGLILSLMILISLIGINRVDFIDRTLTDVSEGATDKQRQAINFRGSVHDRAIAIRDAVLVREPSALEGHLQNIERLDQYYQDAAAIMSQLFDEQDSTAREDDLLEAIEAIERRTLSLTAELIELRLAGEIEEARTFLLEEVSPAYTEWLKRVNAFIDYQEEAITADVGAVMDTASNFQSIILAITVVALIISIMISTVIIRTLKSTLGAEPHEVAEVIRRLAEGQLNHTIHTRYENSVMGALKNTLTRLLDTINQVRSGADALNGSSAELLSTSENNSQQIRLQSREAEQMAAAINEMAASVAEVADYAAQAATATRTADEEVKTGNRIVSETAGAINNLAETLEDAAETVHGVSRDSADIEKIVEVINGIAEQTNLLALNAAIEAARAGTHGRGFAVVADEVRSLANRTQDSTREIQEMIAKLQTGAHKAADVMEASRDKARKTVEQTREAELALASIGREVGAITDMNAQIAAASEQQSAVAEEVNRNITRIHDAAVATSAGSEQVAVSSRELSGLADQLMSKVSFFRA